MKKQIKQQQEEIMQTQIVNVFDIHTLQVSSQDGLLFVGISGLINDEPDDDVLVTFTFNQIKEMYYYLQSENYKTKLNEIRL